MPEGDPQRMEVPSLTALCSRFASRNLDLVSPADGLVLPERVCMLIFAELFRSGSLSDATLQSFAGWEHLERFDRTASPKEGKNERKKERKMLFARTPISYSHLSLFFFVFFYIYNLGWT